MDLQVERYGVIVQKDRGTTGGGIRTEGRHDGGEEEKGGYRRERMKGRMEEIG